MKMDTTYVKTLNKVETKLKRMKEQIQSTRWFYDNGDLKESFERALELEKTAEETVLLTRVLPAYSGAANASTRIDAIISDTIPVEIGFTAEGWFPKKPRDLPIIFDRISTRRCENSLRISRQFASRIA